MKYHVKIAEKLEKTVIVNGSNAIEAVDFVRDAWKSGRIILNADDFVGEDFSIVKTEKEKENEKQKGNQNRP